LFDDISQRSAERNGGYTRIVKLGARKSDSARMAFIEWVDAEQAAEEKPKKEKKAKRKEPEAKPQQKALEPEQPEREEPKAEAPALKEEQPTAPPAEEPKPKKRRWFGRKSDES
jgi:large subunit ribosomal protein L17